VRAGISRVAVEVVILVLAVALALLIFSPVGSFIFGALSRTTMVGGTTQIEVIGIDPDADIGGSHYLVIYVKNQGPNNIPDAGDTSKWTIVVKTTSGESSYEPDAILFLNGSSVASDDTFSVGDTWEMRIQGANQPETSTFTVEVYGPEGTRATQIYRP